MEGSAAALAWVASMAKMTKARVKAMTVGADFILGFSELFQGAPL